MRTARHAASGGILAVVAVLVTLTTSAPADAADLSVQDIGQDLPVSVCLKYPPGPDGIRRQKPRNSEVTGGFAGLPPRVIADIQPGQRGQTCIGFQNRSGSAMSLEFRVTDVGADAQGSPSSDNEGDFGAARWIKLPAKVVKDLKHGEVAFLLVDIDVPRDVTPGSWYASVLASQGASGESCQDSNTCVASAGRVAVQIFFDIPGDASRSGGIRNARVPRVIWWDGWDLGKLPVLDRLRGSGVATTRFQWTNRGDFSESVRGRVIIKSALSGKTVQQIPLPDGLVLRGSSRPYEATWKSDIPLLGRFTPTIEITTAEGKRVTKQLPAIWVIPSWWYLFALTCAIAFPVWLRRRARRRYGDLLARVEAAEYRGADHDDSSEWDDAPYDA